MDYGTPEFHKKEALNWLANFRRPNPSGLEIREYIVNNVKAAGITLAEIGSSELELKFLTTNVDKNSAQYWFGQLKSEYQCNSTTLSILNDYLSRGNLTLSDIDSSQEELDKLEAEILAQSTVS